MRAWLVEHTGDPAEAMTLVDRPAPEAGPGEVVVRVGACGLGYPDLLLTQGKHQERAALPFTPGMEIAGTVHRVGAGVTLAPGDRVVGIARLPHGGLAEFAVAAETDLHPLPERIADVTAAAMHTAYQTAWFGLHHRAALQAGETLLVNAGAGGVGAAAIALGVAAGARVVATAGGAAKTELCRRMGAEHAIDYLEHPDFAPLINELTAGRGADVVFDPVGGDVFDRSRRCIAWEGRLLVIGFASETIPVVKVNHLLIKNYSVLGLYWGPYKDRAPHLIRRAHDEIVQLVLDGRVDPLVMRTEPLTSAATALQSLAGRGTYGRVVVTP
ncbi:MAG: NADPH:quinone oxidoreductase family protein [Jatrophihabitans sp.]|uniref:NADPH:quinone oxidoreductase family protein n=1 Tax=Jatrophihabitans sp. TaxID=1932789 RepID=UPI003F7F1D55